MANAVEAASPTMESRDVGASVRFDTIQLLVASFLRLATNLAFEDIPVRATQ
jgi:hypothetical protein